jgi:hypothetical protein
MLDSILIKECADPTLKPAIVEQFVQAVGSDDPLAITVKSGERLILVPKPKTPQEATEIVRENIKGSVVRVGLTQFPARTVVSDPSKLSSDLFDPCVNLRMGTAMFAKILRIVARWYGNPVSSEVFPQLFDDAIYAWQTGQFEGQNIFRAQDPGGTVVQSHSSPDRTVSKTEDRSSEPSALVDQAGKAGIRIDLSKIGGR